MDIVKPAKKSTNKTPRLEKKTSKAQPGMSLDDRMRVFANLIVDKIMDDLKEGKLQIRGVND